MNYKPRIPRTLAEFNLFICTGVPYLHATNVEPVMNNLRLLLTDSEMESSDSYLLQWHNPDTAHPGVYDLHTNPEKKNKITRKNVVIFMNTFTPWFSKLIDRMATSPAIITSDREVYNITEATGHHTVPTVALRETALVSGDSIGGGDLIIDVRPAIGGSELPHLCEGADIVEYAVKIDGTIPTNENDGTTKGISSHAEFIIHAGLAHRGQPVYVFVRFSILAHQNLAAPWCGPFTFYPS